MHPCLFAKFESIARYSGGSPHRAEAHTCGLLELTTFHPHSDNWKNMRDKHDLGGVLPNPYVKRHINGATGAEMGVRRYKERRQGQL